MTPAIIRDMFSRIAPRYDLLNRLLSLGLDRGWRRRACDSLDLPRDARILDLCAGTGRFAFECARRRRDSYVVACDFAIPMLRLLGRWRRRCAVVARVVPLCGDALMLPFADGAFDAVTNAFGLRSYGDLRAGLREAFRVLRPGGQLVALELFRPGPSPFRTLFEVYFGRGMPWVGRVISGHAFAYQYLHDSVAGFVTQADFAATLGDLGFQGVQWTDLAWGVVTVVTARKPTGPQGSCP
jgi:demethylmenaquinone methyltransferase/2-methoxy-6-polyprenyl-1,4-benzoquinol methylase